MAGNPGRGSRFCKKTRGGTDIGLDLDVQDESRDETGVDRKVAFTLFRSIPFCISRSRPKAISVPGALLVFLNRLLTASPDYPPLFLSLQHVGSMDSAGTREEENSWNPRGNPGEILEIARKPWNSRGNQAKPRTAREGLLTPVPPCRAADAQASPFPSRT